MEKKSTSLFFIISPVLILFITQATAVIIGKFLDDLVYIPIILIYWAVLGIILFKYGPDHIRYWLQKPQGHWIWLIIAGLISFSSLPLFLQHYDILRNLSVLIPSIIFFLINPWLEEFYWRGLLIDVTEKWSAWISIIYSSILFTLWHTAFAWYSTGVRSLSFYLPVLILGLVMGLIYKNTKSLWPAILSHMLINLLNLGIPVLMNMIEF